MKYARDVIQDRFTTVPGVGDVNLGGYTEPTVRVWLNAEKLRKYNISSNDVLDAISTEHTEVPGGLIESGAKNFTVRTLGEAKTIEDFGKLIISRRGGQSVSDPMQVVRLNQVARVEEGLDEVRRLSRYNSASALGLGIRKQRGSNAVAVADQVKARMKEVEKELPEGMAINVTFDSTQFIKDSVKELYKHLIFAVLLTSFVCWVFLGSFSATLNVLLSIPTSIFGTFIALYFLGFTLNTFTLLGLTLAIGIVVDDAIMVLENIFRYSEKGKDRIESAILGSREIAFAALAATAAVVAIFLPVVFMKGAIGVFFMQFGVTISVAVLISLLEALTITPMRCAAFVNHSARSTKVGAWFDKGIESLNHFYVKGLKWSLSHKLVVMIGALGFIALSFFVFGKLEKEMSPAQDQGLFIARFKLPIGTALNETDLQIKAAEQWFRDQPEVRGVYVAVGGFSGSASDSNTALMFVSLIPKNERKKSQEQLISLARKELNKSKDLKVTIQDLSGRGFGGGRGFPVEFSLTGGDWSQLVSTAQTLMKDLEQSGLVKDVDSNYLSGLPELQVTPDRAQAAFHGVSIQQIGRTVNTYIGGVRAGQFSKDGKRYPIKVQLEKSENQLAEVGSLLVSNTRGNLIPLSNLVQIKQGESLQSITRENKQRSISIFANLAEGVSQDKALTLIKEKTKGTLPVGTTLEFSGGSSSMKESFQSLGFALIVGLIVAYMILAAQFNSFLDPISILMALPFSFTGAFLALWMTGQSLNMYSAIGLLLLMGIVKKNSILLVEFTNLLRERDAEKGITRLISEYLIEAGATRLRPILMTSFATIAAAVPSALAIGAGSEAVKSMAIGLIGGVLASTFLTLFVVPIVYLLLDYFKNASEEAKKVREAFARVDGASHS
jgi:HAE1 family hydrophobic/amphiphilic exporter-1